MVTWTRLSILLTIYTLVVLQGTSNGDDTSPGQREAVEEFAVAFLQAYRSKDVSKVFSMLSIPPPESAIAKFVPGTPPYQQLFGESSQQWQAVNSWDGELGDVSLELRAFIVIRKQPSAFGPEEPDVLRCVRLKKEDGNWLFEKFYIAQQAQVNGPEFSELEADSKLYRKLNETTAEIMRAYQQKDSGKVKELSVEEGPWALRGESEKSEAGRLFSPLEMEGVTEWQGKPGRVFAKGEAVVKFGESGESTHYLQLIGVGERWKLKNIKIESK